MYKEHIEELTKSLEFLPKEVDINDILLLFLRHKRIVFCTMGKSAFACRKVVYTARSYGLDWYDLDVCHAFHGDAGIIKDNDLLVLVSKSGETHETVEVARYFSKWETVSVTSNSESALSKLCKNDLHIPVFSEASPFGYAPMISTSLYMIVMHGILSYVVQNSNCTIHDYARNHPHGSIGQLLAKQGLVEHD